MKFALLLLACCGCSFVKEIKKPPHPMFISHHSRLLGVELAIPNQTGDSVFKMRLGLASDSWQLIPCSTNQIFIPAISDDFVMGQTLSLSPDTSFKESLQTGFSPDHVPPLRMKWHKDTPKK